MARTAPVVDGVAWSGRSASFTFIDISGDQRSISIRLSNDATSAQIDALGTALGAATNASLFKITVSEAYVGDAAKTNAAEGGKSASVFDNLVALYTDFDGDRSENVFIPAPIADMFVTGTDNPNPAATAWAAVKTAYEAVNFGSATIKSMRYSERKETNQRVKL